MPLFAVQITKSVSFRGTQQEFSNRYVYEGAIMTPGAATVLATNVKGVEVAFHATDVTFVRYAVWTTGGTPALNQMMAQGNLSGTGSQTNNTSMDRERAILIQWPAGLNIRGQPVYLRKWFHTCGACQGVTFGTSALQQTAEIPGANRTTIATAADSFNTVSNGDTNYVLTAESGRDRSGGASCHRYLEHHQLGDMWR